MQRYRKQKVNKTVEKKRPHIILHILKHDLKNYRRKDRGESRQWGQRLAFDVWQWKVYIVALMKT